MLKMTRNKFFKSSYRSNFRGKVTVEDAQKHQQYIDGMKKDAAFYYLDHIESSMIPHSMLHKIIQKLKTKQNDSFTLQEKAYLIRQNLNACSACSKGSCSGNISGCKNRSLISSLTQRAICVSISSAAGSMNRRNASDREMLRLTGILRPASQGPIKTSSSSCQTSARNCSSEGA